MTEVVVLYDGPIITRKEAVALGLPRYFTGIACKSGHLEQRLTNDTRCRECTRLKARRQYAENRLYMQAKFSAYWQANADRLRARNRAWKADRPGYSAKNERKRQALKIINGGSHTLNDVDRRLKWQKGACAYCRRKVGDNFHKDHIIPLALGGSNAASNIQITCAKCNVSKRAARPEDFARAMGLLI